MFLHKRYLSEASEKAMERSCPDCRGSRCMEYAAPGDNVCVCSSCGYSCEDYYLEEEWIRALADDYGYSYISEEEGDDPDDYIEV